MKVTSRPTSDLLTVERARAFLAQCRDVDEVREIRDKAEAVARYQRARKAADDSAIDAAIIARRAERRLGELVAELPKAKAAPGPGRGKKGGSGVRPPLSPSAPTLADHGITKSESSRWQRMAAVPEKKFEATIAESAAAKRPPTAASVLRSVSPRETKAAAPRKPKLDPPPEARPAPKSETSPSDVESLLDRLFEQRSKDPDFLELRTIQRNMAARLPQTRGQRIEAFVLDGGELAMVRLGLDWSMTAATLKAAYRKASKSAHPDTGGDVRTFQKLTRAHDLVAAFLEAAP